MNITEAGRRRVVSPEFAIKLRKLLYERLAEGVSDEIGAKTVVVEVALALCSLENGPHPTPEALQFFLEQHSKEVNDYGDRLMIVALATESASTRVQ